MKTKQADTGKKAEGTKLQKRQIKLKIPVVKKLNLETKMKPRKLFFYLPFNAIKSDVTALDEISIKIIRSSNFFYPSRSNFDHRLDHFQRLGVKI